MVQVICPSCGSRLNAKDTLAGQVRKCPKCRTPVRIPIPEEEATESIGLADVPPDEQVELRALEPLPSVGAPAKLLPPNRYLICDKTKLVAMWQADGRGWLLKTNAGLVSALRNIGQLPVEGDFQLVELCIKPIDDGFQLDAVTSFQLTHRHALTSLNRGDHHILASITGSGSLNRQQKYIVRQAIKDQLMPEVWADSRQVLDYLANTDYHSPGSGSEPS